MADDKPALPAFDRARAVACRRAIGAAGVRHRGRGGRRYRTDVAVWRGNGNPDRYRRAAFVRYGCVVTGMIGRRLTRLEAEAGIGTDLPVIFVSFAADPDGTDPPANVATGNGRVWHREPGETKDAFLERVGGEARPAQPGCGVVVVFLE